MQELDSEKAKRYADELNRTLSGEDLSARFVAPRKTPWGFFGKAFLWHIQKRETIYWCIFLVVVFTFTKMIFGTIDSLTREQSKYKYYIDPSGEVVAHAEGVKK